MTQNCRLCADPLPEQAALVLLDMPASAQSLPSRNELDRDAPTELRLPACTACGLVQAQAEPVSYYREVIRASAFSKEMGEFRRRQLADFVVRHGLRGKKLLEIGAGRGEYLQLWREAGVQAYGTEFGVASVQACRVQGLAVQQVFPDEPSMTLENGPFDAFASFNFLEHWPAPRETLKAVANNLQDGAVGLIEVPNFDMMLRKQQFTEFISDHLLYFTRKTLRTMLETSGLEVLEMDSVWHDYILSAQVSKRGAIDVSAFSGARHRMMHAVDEFLRAHSEHGVAVWGAGHQALAALSLLGMRGRVRYVVDSAPFKQGKYTPATHIPICAPERLREEPVGAVIVMAAGYSDEVVRTIRERHGKAMQLAILREAELEVLC